MLGDLPDGDADQGCEGDDPGDGRGDRGRREPQPAFQKFEHHGNKLGRPEGAADPLPHLAELGCGVEGFEHAPQSDAGLLRLGGAFDGLDHLAPALGGAGHLFHRAGGALGACDHADEIDQLLGLQQAAADLKRGGPGG